MLQKMESQKRTQFRIQFSGQLIISCSFKITNISLYPDLFIHYILERISVFMTKKQRVFMMMNENNSNENITKLHLLIFLHDVV